MAAYCGFLEFRTPVDTGSKKKTKVLLRQRGKWTRLVHEADNSRNGNTWRALSYLVDVNLCRSSLVSWLIDLDESAVPGRRTFVQWVHKD